MKYVSICHVSRSCDRDSSIFPLVYYLRQYYTTNCIPRTQEFSIGKDVVWGGIGTKHRPRNQPGKLL